MRAGSLIAFGLLGLLVAGFFSDVLLGDNVLLTESPTAYQPWGTYAAEEDTTEEAGRVDCLRAYLPRQVEVSRSIRSGRLRLWDPYIFAGTPFLADPQSRIVYPVSMLLGLVDPVKAMGYDVALHTLIALIGMYLFMRSVHADWYGAMIGALAFGFSSFLFTRHGHPTFVATASWIPLIFYAFERSRKRPVSGTLLLAACLAMGYLAGHPQALLFGVCALVIYAIHAVIEDATSMGVRRALVSARPLVIAGLLSLLLVAIQLLPFLEFLNNSVGLGTDPTYIKGPYQSHPLFLTRLLYPSLYGNPVDGTSWLPAIKIGGHRYTTALIYCGVGSVILAVCASFFVRTRRLVRAMLILLALSLALGISTHLLRAAATVLPLLGYTSIGRVSVITCFALAALAGTGFSAMSSAGNPRLKKYSLYAGACLVGVMLLALLIAVFRGEVIVSYLAKLTERSIDEISDRQRSSVFMSWLQGGTAEWLRYEIEQLALGFVFGALSLALIAVRTLRPPARPLLKHLVSASLVIVIGVDLVIAAGSYYVSQRSGSLFETEGIRTLKYALGQPGDWRTLSYGRRKRVFTPNTNEIFGVYSVQGRGTIIPDTFPRLLRQSRREDSPGRQQRNSYRLSIGTIADVMSARFFLVPELEPAWLPSPVMGGIASEDHLRQKLRILRPEGRSRLSFTQTAGESLSLDIHVPEAVSLDLGVAIEAGVEGCSDSIAVVVRCESESGMKELVEYFDVEWDTGSWHALSLDMSWARPGPGRLTLASRARPERGGSGVAVAWSDLEFVTGPCPQAEIDGGFEIGPVRPGSALSVEIASGAREVPLEIASGNSPPVTRWIGFLPGTTSRRLTFDLGGVRPKRLKVTSDSTFSLAGCKNVHTGSRWAAGYDLFYDGDMLVLENFSALKKGVCIGKEGANLTEEDGRTILRVRPVEKLHLSRSGECHIISYEPERVELETSTDRDGYLVLQETYYPGWRALVDGVSSPILRTDMGLRALELMKGNHTVVMEFAPRSFRLGLMLTLFGLVLATVWAVRSRRRAA